MKTSGFIQSLILALAVCLFGVATILETVDLGVIIIPQSTVFGTILIAFGVAWALAATIDFRRKNRK